MEVALGLVFVAGALLKAADVNLFIVQISYYGVVGGHWHQELSALGALWIETALGAALLLGCRLRGLTFLSVLALLVVFSVLITYGWVYRDLEDCGCFGPIEMSPAVSLVKNGVLAILCLLAWLGLRKSAPPFTWNRPKLSFAAKTVICAGVATGMTLFARAHVEAIIEPGEEARPFAQFVFEAEGVHYDLGSGEYLIVMLDMKCEHCMESVELLNELLFEPDFPEVIGLCYEEEEGALDEFTDLTLPDFPLHSIGERVRTFFSLISNEEGPPRFIYALDGYQVAFWDVEAPDAEEVFAVRAEYQ